MDLEPGTTGQPGAVVDLRPEDQLGFRVYCGTHAEVHGKVRYLLPSCSFKQRASFSVLRGLKAGLYSLWRVYSSSIIFKIILHVLFIGMGIYFK